MKPCTCPPAGLGGSRESRCSIHGAIGDSIGPSPSQNHINGQPGMNGLASSSSGTENMWGPLSKQSSSSSFWGGLPIDSDPVPESVQVSCLGYQITWRGSVPRLLTTQERKHRSQPRLGCPCKLVFMTYWKILPAPCCTSIPQWEPFLHSRLLMPNLKYLVQLTTLLKHRIPQSFHYLRLSTQHIYKPVKRNYKTWAQTFQPRT